MGREGHIYAGLIPNGAWVDADALRTGHRLLNDDGSWAVVEKVVIRPEPLQAFNLTVAETETYFVAGALDSDAVWVHNCIKQNSAKGRASEQWVLADVGLEKNTKKVTSPEGSAIPDAITDSHYVEIKDVKSLSNTKQIRIETKAAHAEGKKVLIVTGKNTKTSGPLKDNVDEIVRRDDLGPPDKE